MIWPGQSMLFGFLGGGGFAPWYGYVFLGLAIIIVWPVELLEEIGRIEVNWKHVLWLEFIAWTVMIVGTILLIDFDQKVRWFVPLIYVLVAIVARLFIWSMLKAFRGEIGDD